MRVRARNVLRRWASVQTDPRLTWVDPLAPLGNLTLVAAVFAQLWRYNAEPDLDAGLTEDDLDDLWNDWLRPFVGTGQGDGWLHRSRLDEQELGARLGGEFARNVTALCWLAIRPGPQHRQRVVRWQPAFRGVLEHNLVEVEEDTAEYLTAIGYPVSSDRVLTDILEALDFIDDDLWCAQKAAELALTHLAIEMVGTGHRDALRLMVSGIADPLNDPRVPALLTSIGQYRSADILTVVGEDHDWRLAVPTDSRIYFMSSLAAAERESVPLRAGEIEKLVVAGGVLGDLFPLAARYA